MGMDSCISEKNSPQPGIPLAGISGLSGTKKESYSVGWALCISETTAPQVGVARVFDSSFSGTVVRVGSEE